MQSASPAVLINKIAIVSGLQQLLESHDVVAGLQHVVDRQLIVYALLHLQVLCQDAIADHLYRNNFIRFQVFGLENLAVRARPYDFCEFVLADYSAGVHLGYA